MLDALRSVLLSAIESGQSQNAISSATGVPQSTLSTFLSGKTGINGKAFAVLASYFGGVLTFPGGVASSSFRALDRSGEEKLRARIAELERELAAANARADAYRDALSLARPAAPSAPVAEEKRRPTTPTSIPYSRMEE